MITGKNIVITGASSGIGLDTLRLLMRGEGNRILGVARNIDVLKGMANNVIPFSADISSVEGVEAVFAKAEEEFGNIDIFYANAGFPYYEKYDYTDWDRIVNIFNTNTISPIYTYSRYVKHLNGRKGMLALTISAMGEMAMPGYSLYAATKFAMHGFQEAIRMEKPENLDLVCLYPVATDTNFFNVGGASSVKKPFPVQSSLTVAKKMVKGMEKSAKSVSPSGLFDLSKFIFAVVPPVQQAYLQVEKNKFKAFLEKRQQQAQELLEAAQARAAERQEQAQQLIEVTQEKLSERITEAKNDAAIIKEKVEKDREEIRTKIVKEVEKLKGKEEE